MWPHRLALSPLHSDLSYIEPVTWFHALAFTHTVNKTSVPDSRILLRIKMKSLSYLHWLFSVLAFSQSLYYCLWSIILLKKDVIRKCLLSFWKLVAGNSHVPYCCFYARENGSYFCKSKSMYSFHFPIFNPFQGDLQVSHIARKKFSQWSIKWPDIRSNGWLWPVTSVW